MTKILLIIISHFPAVCLAQLYFNASENLPDVGAKGSTMDAQVADLEGDGDLDIVLANEFQPNTILINDGTGIFSNGTFNKLPQEDHDSEDVVIGDFNSDGFLDLIFCSEDDVVLNRENVHEYYLGNGLGRFHASTNVLDDSEANAVIFADISMDGHLDLIFGNNGLNNLLINDGNGRFHRDTTRLPKIKRTTQDLALLDIDNDGDLDLFEANEDGNVLLVNDGKGFFSDMAKSNLPQGINMETRKVSFADVDGDKDLDIFLSNVEFILGKVRQNRLYLNDGSGIYSDVTTSHLPGDNDHTIDAIFEDIEGDGDVDLVIGNIGGAPIRFYVNDGSGIFSNSTLEVLGQYYYRDALAVVAEDFNNDGLNDIYICDRKQRNTNNKDLLLLRQDSKIHNKEESLVKGDFEIINEFGSENYTLNIKNKVPELILISDMEGQLVMMDNEVSDYSINLDLSEIPKGSYYVIVQFIDMQQVSKKLVRN